MSATFLVKLIYFSVSIFEVSLRLARAKLVKNQCYDVAIIRQLITLSFRLHAVELAGELSSVFEPKVDPGLLHVRRDDTFDGLKGRLLLFLDFH